MCVFSFVIASLLIRLFIYVYYEFFIGNFFGYVDEHGNVVYVDMDQDEDEVDNMIVIPNLDIEGSNINNVSDNINNHDNNHDNYHDNSTNNNDNNNNNDNTNINDNNNNNNNDKSQINNSTMDIDENTVTLESVSLQLTKMEFKSEPSQKHGKKIDKYKKLPNMEKFNPGIYMYKNKYLFIYTYLYIYERMYL
jgi:cobalamin biosynthesis protein CobT